ncbi:MAG TPA: pyridoxal 5'-phosphate synthase glutaminase subunit PdxT [Caldithrix abyssi]|uniref:pyridoxal 5'-phosphate synthase (glutamine hydrolyzing) n=1 Tax=Caldithrix abyssi TaxID=187145 RepID=A0A7V4U421_CALAY|nr:pyridoxal 5'-phosphate synthase glutaminase subunit PdxT [Caldithrix abyssi]
MAKIGILALQGDFYRHSLAVRRLEHEAVLVKDEAALKKCDKLIIPGGESTTFLHLMEKLNLRQPLLEFGREKAIMGTCAGLITLSKSAGHLPFPPLGLIDITVERNAYGRQVDSFVDTIRLNVNGTERPYEGVFIRAPKIAALGSDVRPLAWHKDDVVMAASENILVATFHPELTDDLRIHAYFIEQVG